MRTWRHGLWKNRLWEKAWKKIVLSKEKGGWHSATHCKWFLWRYQALVIQPGRCRGASRCWSPVFRDYASCRSSIIFNAAMATWGGLWLHFVFVRIPSDVQRFDFLRNRIDSPGVFGTMVCLGLDARGAMSGIWTQWLRYNSQPRNVCNLH